jgi:hypothetical protein
MESTPFSADSGIGLPFGFLSFAIVDDHCTGVALLFEAQQYRPLDDGHSDTGLAVTSGVL